MPLGRRTVYRGRNLKIEFELDETGMAAVAVGNEVRDACHDIAENKAKPYAISISPIDSGDYISSWRVVDSTILWGKRWRVNRAVSRLWNISDHAAAVEWGNKHIHGYRVLGETLDHLGGNIDAHGFG